jgi:hypothetical protein
MVLNELKTPGATPLEKRSAHPQQPMAFGTRITHFGAQHRQLRDVGGDAPRVVAREELRAARRPNPSQISGRPEQALDQG